MPTPFALTHPVSVASHLIGGGEPLALIAGPCVLEGREMALQIASIVKRVGEEFGIVAIFKASFDKANRQSLGSFRGLGMQAGLEILAEVKAETGLPVVTDIHECAQAEPVGAVVDLVQVPAFLSRQTDLVVAAARTGKPVLLKKSQMMAPEDMGPIIAKAVASGAARRARGRARHFLRLPQSGGRHARPGGNARVRLARRVRRHAQRAVARGRRRRVGRPAGVHSRARAGGRRGGD